MIRQAIRKLTPHGGNILSAVLGQGLGMVGIAVGTRLLTEQASRATFGEAKLLIGLVTLLMGVLVRPFHRFVMREYHDAVEQGLGNRLHAFARRVQLGLAAGTGGVLCLGLLLFRPPSGAVLWVIPFTIGGMLVFQGMLGIERGMMITTNRQFATSVLIIGQHWALPVVTALVLYLTVDSLVMFVSAQCAVWAFLVLVAYRISGPVARLAAEEERSPSWNAGLPGKWMAEARRFVIPMIGLGAFQWVVSVGDRYILAAYVDLSEVGTYVAVYGLISAPFLAVGILTARLSQPFYFRAAATRNVRRRRLLKLGMIGFAAGVATLAVLAVSLLGDWFARLLLAEEYRAGARPLMIWLTAGYGFLIVCYGLETEAYASKKTMIMTVAYGVAAAVNIAANLLLIPRNGILGAAQATCLTFAVYLLILAWLDFRQVRRQRDQDLG